MLALKICSLARDVPDPELTVTSQGTGNDNKPGVFFGKGRPKMVFLGLLAMFESKWDRSVICCAVSGTVGEVNAVCENSKRLTAALPGEGKQSGQMKRRNWIKREHGYSGGNINSRRLYWF